MARMRVLSPPMTVLLCAFFVVLLLVTPCTAARALRPDDAGRRLSEENFKAAEDAVPTAAKLTDNERKYSEWVRFQAEEVTQDYGGTPAVANPSVPCCTP